MENEVVIVTGGTSGIGRAVSILLSKSGFNVLAIYAHNDQKAKELSDNYSNINVKKADVLKANDINSVIEEIEKNNERIIGLVNSAGITNDGYFLMMSIEKWNNVIDVNLNGTFNANKQILRHMRINNVKGSIVNLASTSGVTGQVGQANYSASKGAIIALTKTLSKEMAPYGIRVNSVSPGFVNTDMTLKLKNKKQYEKLIPMGRFGEPEEIANLIEFLISNKSSYITGKNIIIDGGMIND